MPEKTPFIDQQRVRSEYYADVDRVSARSRSLLGAKVLGTSVQDVVVELIGRHLPIPTVADRVYWPGTIADIGCGRGSSSLALTKAYPAAHLVMVELSERLLRCAKRRVTGLGLKASAVRADFHRLPLADGSCSAVVAAFCLYHSEAPGKVLNEIARSLDRSGIAVLVTKSADSYRELDAIVASSGLDPQALRRPSLYTTANSENLASLASTQLEVLAVVNEQHVFQFLDLAAVAVYLATSPKYAMPEFVAGHADRIERHLKENVAEQGLQTTSTVTFVVARTIRRSK